MSARTFTCPAYADGECHREHAEPGAAHCPMFRCGSCLRHVPWCFGDSDGDDCNDCSTWADLDDARAYVG